MTRWDLSHTEESLAAQPVAELEIEPLSLTERYQFFVQLSTLFTSGCPLLESLEAISEGEGNSTNVQLVAQRMTVGIERGASISESMRRQGPSFSRTEIGLIKMGERTGRLSHVLEKVQKNLSLQKQNRQQLLQACLYPAVTFLFALSVVGLMAFVLLPRLLPVFASFQAELPWPTKLVAALAGAWSWGLLVFLVLGFGTVLYLRERELPSELFHSIPAVGDALQAKALGEIAASLSVLLAAGATFDSSFELLSEQAGSRALREGLLDARSRLRNGETFAQALESQEAFPQLFVQLLIVGSEVGRLDYFSDRAADIFLEDFHWQTQRTVQLLEPLLLTFLGVFVGFLLMACFLPFYNLLTVTL